jgi:hypothetical protein
MKSLFILAVVLVASASLLPGNADQQAEKKQHFYNVDKEIRVEGAVQEVVFEPRYQGRAPFLIVLLEESGKDSVYSVEVSPSWFFDQDLHKGEKVRIIGSLAGEKDGVKTVIARQMNLRGETLTLRDKRGFPSWSGGARLKRKRRIGSF